MHNRSLFIFVLAAATYLLAAKFSGTTPAYAQGSPHTPPFCTGPNAALQYNEKGWVCATIAVTPLPAQPPPSQCITSNWNGTAWMCVPTDYLTAGTQPAPPRRALRATDSNGCEWTLTGPGPASGVSQWQPVNPADARCAVR
jgi:hypothetical protein